MPARLEHVLILGMDYGLVLFTSDRGITPAAAAKLADDHGFATFYVPEHTHIPVKRRGRPPHHRRRVAARRPLHAHPGSVGVSLGTAARSPRGCGCRRRWRCPSSTTRSRWRSRSPRWITFPAAGSASASDSVGTQTNSPTTTCRPGGGAPCCASTWRPCARCGPRKRRRTTASSSTSARAGRGRSRSSRTSRCWSARRAPRRTSSGSPAVADGWITTPRDFDIDEPVKLLQDTWAAAGRDGAPQIVALDFKPDPEKLARWADLGVTEVLFGLPDKSEAEVAAYVERLAGKLAALV